MTEKDVTAACLFAMGSGRSSGLYLRSHQEGAGEDKELDWPSRGTRRR